MERAGLSSQCICLLTAAFNPFTGLYDEQASIQAVKTWCQHWKGEGSPAETNRLGLFKIWAPNPLICMVPGCCRHAGPAGKPWAIRQGGHPLGGGGPMPSSQPEFSSRLPAPSSRPSASLALPRFIAKPECSGWQQSTLRYQVRSTRREPAPRGPRGSTRIPTRLPHYADVRLPASSIHGR